MSNSRSKRMLGCVLSLVTLAVLVSPVFSSNDDPGDEFLRGFRWRNIGPANMGGRISDIQALDGDYRLAVVASASGGVWKTVNAGTTWEPIFDDYGSGSIGAVGLFQKNPDITTGSCFDGFN